MFDKFGEFDSYEEINRAAKAQLEEGDLEAIKTIAEENGLDPEDAFLMRTVEDAIRFKERLKKQNVKHAVVIGASMAGI